MRPDPPSVFELHQRLLDWWGLYGRHDIPRTLRLHGVLVAEGILRIATQEA